MNHSQRQNNKFFHLTKLIKNTRKDDKFCITNYLSKNPKSCNITPIPNSAKNNKTNYSYETMSELKLQNKKLSEQVKDLKSKILELNNKLNQYNNISINNITYRNKSNFKNSNLDNINITDNSQSILSQNSKKTKKRISFNFTAYPTSDNSKSRISRSYTNFSSGNTENSEFEFAILDLEKRVNQTTKVIPSLIQKYKKYKELYENIKDENVKLKKDNEELKITLHNIRKELIVFQKHSENNINDQNKKLFYLNNFIVNQKKDFDEEKKQLINSLTNLAQENKLISQRLIQLSEREKKIEFNNLFNNHVFNNEQIMKLNDDGIVNLKRKFNTIHFNNY